MFTVIIQGKRSSDLMRDHKFLFKPFIDNGTLAFCDWNESGTDVKSSVPDLYKIIRGKKEWRALIVNTDSVYEYKDVERPGTENPFDYSRVDAEASPHESPIPLIRLTHIIGGYSAVPTKEFEKGFEYFDEQTGELMRVREDDLTEDEIQQLSIDCCDELVSVYLEKEVDPKLLESQQALSKKYSFSDIRPTEILMISTRRKDECDEKDRVFRSWKNNLEASSSSFWERNKYPNNCRFLFCDITNTDNSMYKKELTEFWLSVLTLANNRITASTLQAYRLYKLHVDVSSTELSQILNSNLNRLHSAYSFVNEQFQLRPEYSFEEDEAVIERQTVPVAIKTSECKELYINLSKIGLCRDCPQDESAFWYREVKQKKETLDNYLKSPRRAIEKSASILKAKSESFAGRDYELDKFQLEDLKEYMSDLEIKIFSSGAENAVDKQKINDEISQTDKSVRKEISYRLRKKGAIIGGAVALAVVFGGYVPYIIQSAKISPDSFAASFCLTLIVLLLVSLGGLISLLVQRGHIISLMKKFNDIMRNVAGTIRAYSEKFEYYFSNICTYMKARSIIDGIHMREEDVLSNYSMLNAHRQALKAAIDRDCEWMCSYSINREDEMIPNVTSFFNVNVVPKENKLYYFVMNDDEKDIPINSTGDFVTSPYKFVEKLWIEREDIFDEEEANV